MLMCLTCRVDTEAIGYIAYINAFFLPSSVSSQFMRVYQHTDVFEGVKA